MIAERGRGLDADSDAAQDSGAVGGIDETPAHAGRIRDTFVTAGYDATPGHPEG